MSESRCTWCGMLSEGDHAPNCPVGEAKKLRAHNADLERQLAEENERKKVWENLASDYANKNLELAQRAEQAEQRIAESRRQAPVAEYNWVLGDWECTWNELFEPAEGMLLYPAPIVPPDVEEAVKAVLDEAKSRILSMTFMENPHIQATVTTCVGVLDAVRARSTK